MRCRLPRGRALRLRPSLHRSFGACSLRSAHHVPCGLVWRGRLPPIVVRKKPEHIVAYSAPALAREFHLTGCSSQASACLALFRGKSTPPEVLRTVAKCYTHRPTVSAPGSSMLAGNFPVVALLRVAAGRRAGCEAFAMGLHQRLGAGSLVQHLEVGVVQMILDQV